MRAIPDEEFFGDGPGDLASRRCARGATRVADGATLVRTDSDTEKYLRLIEVYTPPGPAALVGFVAVHVLPAARACARRCRPVPLVNLLRLNAWVAHGLLPVAPSRPTAPWPSAVASAAEAVRLRLTTRPG